jgi:single-strand DNA-binding protein
MINTVALMGRLTHQPELRVTPSGVNVINFNIACDRQYQTKGKESKTDFIDCLAWKNTAEFIIRYFKKGDMIAVEGCIQTDNYTDKNGNKRKSVVVVAKNVSFCGSKEKPNLDINNGNSAFTQPAPRYASADSSDFEEIVDDDDDLPW